MSDPKLHELSQTDRFCLWIDWLSGETSDELSREIAADVTRPEGHIFGALEGLEQVVRQFDQVPVALPYDKPHAKRIRFPAWGAHDDERLRLPNWVTWRIGIPTVAIVIVTLLGLWLARLPSSGKREKPGDAPIAQQDGSGSPPPPAPEQVDPGIVGREPGKDDVSPIGVPRAAEVMLAVSKLEARYQDALYYPVSDPDVSGVIRTIEAVRGTLSGTARKEAGSFLLKTRAATDILGIMVPAYFDPATRVGLNQWNRMEEHATGSSAVPIIAIANPDNGPGEESVEAYSHVIGQSTDDADKKTFYRVIGFVDCVDRNREQIEGDIRRWVLFYPQIRGFYFYNHEATKATTAAWASLFAKARKSIQEKGFTEYPLIVSNPAAGWDSEFFDGNSPPNILCFDNKQPGGDDLAFWPLKHPGVALAAFESLTVTDDPEDLKQPLAEALAYHLKWFYVGPKRRSLPDFFDEEVAEVRKINRSIQANAPQMTDPLPRPGEERMMMNKYVVIMIIATASPALSADPPQASGLPRAANLRERLNHLKIAGGPLAGGFRLQANDDRLNWYFANIGLIPVCETNPKEVRAYLNLYLANKNPATATIEDVSDIGKGVTQSPDSDDSYAATLLSLAVCYEKTSRDLCWWDANRTRLKEIGRKVLLASQKPSGLTPMFAADRRAVAYLMDNCEVYRGLADFSGLLAGEGDPDAKTFADAAERVARGIAGLYDDRLGAFCVADTEAGTSFYPLRVAQTFPEVFNVPLGEPAQTRKCYDAAWDYFNATEDRWEEGMIKDGSLGGYPWMILGYAAAVRGDMARARVQYDLFLRELSKPHPRPQYTAIHELGWAIRLEALLEARPRRAN